MTGQLILPPNYVKITAPLIFLAGPIQGAYDWQNTAAENIHEQNPDLFIANPRAPRWDVKSDYNAQVDWETFHLRKAGEIGVVLFWLAKEHEHYCERAYAQTTRFELAEWKMKHEFYGTRMVVGIEDGFTNAKYIRRRFSQDCPKVPILTNLEDTCSKVVELANKL